MSNLRKGRTKTLIESSIDCALLAVEIYNKPRAPFRVESFITNMIMAWTRLLHAYFHHTGIKYFYKEKNNRFKLVDGDKKAWELKYSVTKYGQLTDPIRTNLELFIKLRNKIEHHCIDKDEIGLMIFGECQALLYNFENELITIFGKEYALNESLAFSLQFSTIRTVKQSEASKQLLSSEVRELKEFIEKYRNSIANDIFNSQHYSIKLIQVPKIANANKNDLAIEFVNWNSMSEDDKNNFQQLLAIVKDKVVKTEALNIGKIKPGDVVTQVANATGTKFNHYDHKCLYSIFSVRPCKDGSAIVDPFQTNTAYCHYDEAHYDYLFQDSWVNILVKNIANNKFDKTFWKLNFDNKIKLSLGDYE